MATKWFYRHSHHVEGPVPFADLVMKVRQHQLQADDLVREDWNSEWRPAALAVGLFHMAGRAELVIEWEARNTPHESVEILDLGMLEDAPDDHAFLDTDSFRPTSSGDLDANDLTAALAADGSLLHDAIQEAVQHAGEVPHNREDTSLDARLTHWLSRPIGLLSWKSGVFAGIVLAALLFAFRRDSAPDVDRYLELRQLLTAITQERNQETHDFRGMEQKVRVLGEEYTHELLAEGLVRSDRTKQLLLYASRDYLPEMLRRGLERRSAAEGHLESCLDELAVRLNEANETPGR